VQVLKGLNKFRSMRCACD